MKQFNICLALFFLLTTTMVAQSRYLDEVFTGVTVEKDVKYATNISVLTGAPVAKDLYLDIYSPAGDDETNRPLFLYFHTGSFLPQYLNNQITGGKRDSSVVEICKQLARRGYVAAAVSYRAGWNPVAQDQDERTSTLLKAAYRGIHDMKAAVRYFRMSVAEMENPYGIDPDKIGLWGQGTGGYIAFGTFLDDLAEIQIEKFIDGRTAQFYVNEQLDGNVDGTNQTPLNLPNWVGYSSDVQFVVEMGGAMGDIGWVNGDPSKEPPVMGFHVSTDPFAPYADGAVTVPVTNQFVVNVSGPRTVVDSANVKGLNAKFEMANAEDTPINAKVQEYKTKPFPGDSEVSLATENVYPFVFVSTQSGPWEWWNFEELQLQVAGYNAATGDNKSAATLDFTGKLTNPDMSKEKALRYIDTMMTYTAPRAFYAFNLTTSLEEIIDESSVALEMYPNPASDYVVFRTDAEMPMKDIAIYNIEGRLLRVVMGINNHAYELQRNDLAPGMYVVKLRFDEGIISKKLIIRD